MKFDSDVPNYYQRFVNISENAHPESVNDYEFYEENTSSKQVTLHNFTNVYATKSKLVAWVASSCVSQNDRESYVHELKKYIQVCTIIFSISFFFSFLFVGAFAIFHLEKSQ